MKKQIINLAIDLIKIPSVTWNYKQKQIYM